MTQPMPATRHPATETSKLTCRMGTKHAAARGSLKKSEQGITPGQMKRVEEAWGYEWPDTKACDYAGITIGKLRTVYEKDPELRKKRDILKSQGKYIAKKNVVESLQDGDIQTTRWFLERRDRDYSNKTQVDVNVTHSLNEAQIIERLSKFMKPGIVESFDHSVVDVDLIEAGPVNAADHEDHMAVE
jgi:hypothetical protein